MPASQAVARFGRTSPTVVVHGEEPVYWQCNINPSPKTDCALKPGHQFSFSPIFSLSLFLCLSFPVTTTVDTFWMGLVGMGDSTALNSSKFYTFTILACHPVLNQFILL